MKPIPLVEIPFGPEEEAAVTAVLRSGWIMQGPEVERFEADFAVAVGAPQACALSSGTAALSLTLHALGVGPGDEVITVSHSFIATAASIVHVGATPVFVDIDRQLNLDPDAVARAITPRTRALLCVHQLGMPCDLGRLLPLARQHGLLLVEDAACALGSEIDLGGWQRLGAPVGDAACFSFHPRKIVTTGDGGMVTTSDAALAARLRRLRNHDLPGFSEVAFNYRLTDMQAALGRVQLARLTELVAARRRIAAGYHQLLADLPLRLPVEPVWARSNWQSYCVEVDDAPRVRAALDAAGIANRPGITNAHQTAAYARFARPLPASERASSAGLMLPIFPTLSDEQQAQVAAALRSALSRV